MNHHPQAIDALQERLGEDYATIDDAGIMICPLCGEETTFRWCMDLAGEEWAECTKCGGQADLQEIDAANREGIPTLVPIQRKVQLPNVPEWDPPPPPTRLDIYPGCPIQVGLAVTGCAI
jgi:hypothetical protein